MKSFAFTAYLRSALFCPLTMFLLPALFLVPVSVLFAAPAAPSGPPHTGTGQPNIILIVADDLGYGDLGCYGQQLIRTPAIDSLARSGMRFTDFYSGSTVCAPSRESLLTGMHTGHTFIKGNFDTGPPEGDLSVPDATLTMAEHLGEAGYRTAIIGKWGIGSPGSGPNTQGFDYSLCYLDQISAHNYYPPHLFENEEEIPLPDNKGGQEKSYSHDVFVNKTLEYIQTSDERPFFLYLPYTIPHGEHVIPDDAPYSEKDWPQNVRNYAAMITRLDRDIGRITQLLKEQGKQRNTVILFTSDNGANTAFARFFKSNGGLRGAKRDLYEGGIRVPLIVSWPGKVAPGKVTSRVTAAWDLLPTLCEIAGTPPPEHIDGISVLPELLGEPTQQHEYLYWEYYAYNWNWGKKENRLPRNWLESQAVRQGKWKAVKTGISEEAGARLALFNLETDPSEEQDLAEAHPEIVRQINRYLKQESVSSRYFPFQESLNAVADSLHIISVQTAAELKDLFRYTPGGVPFVSAHRGGAGPGFPENCIATFENTLRHTHASLEVDPRYTKDSVIVLMHDETLDRTTNGSGRVADHTWAELQKLKLKDTEGDVTPYGIPTLEEALEWAKGKTVLILDQKDVSMEARAGAVGRLNAEANAMLIVYSYEDARRCYQLNKDIMMEIMIPDAGQLAEFEQLQIPWENIVAFVGHKKPDDKRIYNLLHEKGVKCIVGSSRIYDQRYLAGDKQAYERLVREGADIIEADLAIQAGTALMELKNMDNSAPTSVNKRTYFKKQPF